jgi:hypothetical protein
MVVEKACIRCAGQGKRAAPDMTAAMARNSVLLTFFGVYLKWGKMISTELRGD